MKQLRLWASVVLAFAFAVALSAQAQAQNKNDFGSPYERILAKTADYTVVAGEDVIRVDSSSGAVTITLYSPADKYPSKGDYGRVRVVKTSSDTYPITVATAAGSIVGNAVLRVQNQAALFESDGIASWYNFAPVPSVFTASVSITNAELKALRATPKTLVQAQGAGTVVEFVGAVLLLDYGTNVFTESADNAAVKYTNGSGVAVSDTIECTGFIDASADTATSAVPVKDAIVAATGNANKALVLHNTGDGEWGGNAGADTVMRVKISFSVHTTGW